MMLYMQETNHGLWYDVSLRIFFPREAESRVSKVSHVVVVICKNGVGKSNYKRVVHLEDMIKRNEGWISQQRYWRANALKPDFFLFCKVQFFRAWNLIPVDTRSGVLSFCNPFTSSELWPHTPYTMPVLCISFCLPSQELRQSAEPDIVIMFGCPAVDKGMRKPNDGLTRFSWEYSEARKLSIMIKVFHDFGRSMLSERRHG